MAGLSDFEKMLPALSRGEKTQILKWVVRELDDDFPGIDTRPDVGGGEPCIVRTRIPVWLLEQARRLGTSEQALLAAYPNLRAEDLVAWAYVRSHTEEIESQIRENEAAGPAQSHTSNIPAQVSLRRQEYLSNRSRRIRTSHFHLELLGNLQGGQHDIRPRWKWSPSTSQCASLLIKLRKQRDYLLWIGCED